jgi:transporter family protein
LFGILLERNSEDEAVVSMGNWLLFSIFAFLSYGFWAFFPRLARNYVNLPSILFFEIIGAMSVCCLLLIWWRFDLQTKPLGVLFGVLTGVCGALGAVCFLQALTLGKASVVVTVTALYPLVTVVLAFLFLDEPLAARQWLGLGLAILAMILMGKGPA